MNQIRNSTYISRRYWDFRNVLIINKLNHVAFVYPVWCTKWNKKCDFRNSLFEIFKFYISKGDAWNFDMKKLYEYVIHSSSPDGTHLAKLFNTNLVIYIYTRTLS